MLNSILLLKYAYLEKTFIWRIVNYDGVLSPSELKIDSIVVWRRFSLTIVSIDLAVCYKYHTIPSLSVKLSELYSIISSTYSILVINIMLLTFVDFTKSCFELFRPYDFYTKFINRQIDNIISFTVSITFWHIYSH